MTCFRTILKLTLLLALTSNLALFAGTGLITTVAGTGPGGSAGIGGPASSAQLNMPVGVCYDPAGNLFIADYVNNRVVRVDAVTGILTLVAGIGTYATSGDGGPAALAAVNGPLNVIMDAAGNLYISEYGGHRVRKVDMQTGIITTFAGTGVSVSGGDSGPATMAGVPAPVGLAFDASGNLYLAEYGHNIRRVDAVTGIITTVLANGPSGASNPSWLAFDHSGNLLISDSGRYEILRLNLSTGTFDVFAGHFAPYFDGDGIPAVNSSVGIRPIGIAVDPAGNVYLACPDQNRIRRIDAVTGIISTVAGNGSTQTSGPDGVPANNVGVNPQALAIGPDGSLAFSDSAYPLSLVRRIGLPSPFISTATSLVFTPATASPGQSVTFTATPLPLGGSGTPTGTVTFMDPTTRQIIGSTSLAAGTATFSINAPTSTGTYHAVASYAGDSTFAASVSPDTVLTVQTGLTATTLSLTSSANPSVVGDQVNFAATITPSGSGTPTGTLTVKDAGVVVLTAPVSGTGVWFSIPLTLGTHPLIATYSGDSHFLGSTSGVLNQVVNTSALIVSLSTNANPAGFGSPVTFTASVSAAATGVVEFIETAPPAINTLGTAPLVNGVAALTVSSLSLGTHAIQAYYHGDATHDAKYSTVLNQGIITKTTAVITVSSWMNPGILGIQFNIAAAVTAPAGSSGVPTGSVQLLDGSTPLGTVNLTNGQALFPVTFSTIGTHTLTAIYAGDSAFGGVTSQPFSEVVKNTVTFWKTTATPTPAVAGSPITITAYIVQTAATGTVDFVDGINGPNIPLGSAPLINGTATITTSILTAGTHEIYATYNGDANYISAASPSSLVVKAPSTAVVTAAPAAPVYGQAVQLTASVPAAATGSVQFLDGATVLGSVPVSSGTAVLSVPSFSAGTHSITGTYSGDATYAGITSPAVAVTVTKATSSITLSSSQNPAPSGQAVTFTIVLTPAATTGSVQLMEGSTVLANLGVGITTASVSFTVGSHSVTAVYSGDANFNGATSAAVSQLATTTTATAVSADLSNSIYGQAVRLTAAVTPAPTGGTVQFLDGSTTLGTVALQGGAASLSVSTLSVGSHAISAMYSGDGAGYLGSTSAVITETVSKASTSAALAVSPNPATAGQAVTLAAAVSPASATGTVQFLDGATVLGAVPVSNGAATLSTSGLGAGSHSLTAVYSGDATNSPSTSAVVALNVSKAATSATLAASPNPATVGQAVTLTAAISPAGAGTVQFLDGATILGTVPVNNGAASLSTSTLGAGSHSLTAVYSGDATNSPSTSAVVALSVSKAATSATLAASPNPATVGQSVTLNAAVSPAGATGTVQFLDGGTLLGAVPVTNGAASFSTSFAAGSHSLTAIYSGDAANLPSSSVVFTEIVNKAASTASIVSSLNPSVSGHAVTFIAQVTPAATGTVQFKDGVSLLGTVTVSGGAAALAVSSLLVGSHSITAIYSGDTNYTGSASAALTQTVTPAPPGAPSNLTATPNSNSQINLAWTGSATGGVTYTIYGSTMPGFISSAGNRIAAGVDFHRLFPQEPVAFHYLLLRGDCAEFGRGIHAVESGRRHHAGQRLRLPCRLHGDYAVGRRLRHRHHHHEQREQAARQLEAHVDLGGQPADHAGVEFHLYADRSQCVAVSRELEQEHRSRRDD